MNRLCANYARFALALLLAGCVLLPVTHHAQAQAADITVTIDDVDTSAFPTVRLRVSVRDRYGVPIPDLMPEHFEIIEDGAATFQPATLDTESNPRSQVSLAIVIDMYTTLEGEPIEAAQEATRDLLTDLLDEPDDPDRAAFVGIRRDVSTDPSEINPEYEVPFTNDRNMLLNVINFLHERLDRSGPGTPLYDAVIKGIRMAEATEPVGHRAVIVMTDGKDRESVSKDSDTIQQASNARTPVFTVGLSNSGLDEQYLRRLAEHSGGTYQPAETPDDFSPLFSNVLTTLRTQYVLSYDSGLAQDGMEHSLLVHVRTPTQMENYAEQRIKTPGSGPEPVAQETEEGEEVAGEQEEGEPAEPVDEPESPTESAPSEEPTPTPEAGVETPEDIVAQVRDWVQDNMLLAALIVAAIGLLFLVLVIVLIIVIRRRGQVEEEILAPEVPAYPAAPPVSLGETGPGLGMAPTGPAGPGATEFASGAAPAHSPTAAAGGPVPFGTTPSPPFPGPAAPPSPFAQPAAQPPPAAAPQAPQPPMAGGTRVLERAPKMPKVGLLIDRKNPSRRYDVAKPTVQIGRAQNCDVVLDHATVSRQHAAIKLEEGEFRLYDLGSSNGTFLGEQRVREPVTLEDSAEVRFGEIACIFKIVSLETGD